MWTKHYPDAVLDALMAQIRSGETKSAACSMMGLNADHATAGLRRRFPDFEPRMKANMSQRKGKIGKAGVTRRKQPFIIHGIAQDAKRQQDYQDHLDRLPEELRAKSILADLSAEQVAAWVAKIEGWIRTGAGVQSSAPPRSVIRSF